MAVKINSNLRKSFFAWLLIKGDRYNFSIYDSFKKKLFENISGNIAEIGPGTGINFNYMPSGTNWIGIEPNTAFTEYLLTQAKKKGINAKLLVGSALELPLDDNSMDFVIGTLVFCSVEKIEKSLSEIIRVLKPGGKYIFIEHVAAPKNTPLRFIQNMINPINHFFADGCNCNRETWTFIKNCGFSEIVINEHKIKSLKIHSPHIMGFAVK